MAMCALNVVKGMKLNMNKYEKNFESERIYYIKITKDLIEDYLEMINDIEIANKISHNP